MGAVGLTHLPHLKLPAIEDGVKIQNGVRRSDFFVVVLLKVVRTGLWGGRMPT